MLKWQQLITNAVKILHLHAAPLLVSTSIMVTVTIEFKLRHFNYFPTLIDPTFLEFLAGSTAK